MNNEIGRKITSLTLMTIMLAGGMFAVVPAMVPAAHAANANLFVSAENSQFNNYMSGPQVIEVVVIDSAINDTDQGKGEPDVKVNGKKLRMIQAVDGNWYGYFADKAMATTADATTTVPGQGLDFGKICTAAQAAVGTGLTFTDTVGVALNTASCGASFSPNTPSEINVVREAKTINNAVNGAGTNPSGVTTTVWPFIQLYSLSQGGNVVVSYNKGGGVQSTTLTFDTSDQFAKVGLDKVKYTQKSQVHATITDLWLNIDPTDEDSWTFGTNSAFINGTSTNYQVFNENGGVAGAGVASGIINIKNALPSLMTEKNGKLILNVNKQGSSAVLTLQDNDDSSLACTNAQDSSTCAVASDGANTVVDTLGLPVGSQPITFTEQGPNSGIFGSYDEADKSVILVTDNAARGTSGTINYNEKPVTILIGFDFASITLKPTDAEWNSGEEIPIILVDADANKNSRADEDLDLFDPGVSIIPSLRTGTPFTLGTTTVTATLDSIPLTANNQKFSDRQMFKTSAAVPAVINGDTLVLTTGTMKNFFTAAPIDKTNFKGFALFNYDIRSLTNSGNLTVNSVNISLNGFPIGTNQPLQGLILIEGASLTSLKGLAPTVPFTATFTLNGAGGSTGNGVVLPMVADVFGFGFLNNGLQQNERIANQIIRFELEETGDNTSTFAGTVEYTMLNQLNILDKNTYTNLSTIADDPTFIVIEDLDNEESPRVNYNDLGADGTVVQVSAQQAAPAHSGIVSLGSKSFKIGDTVTVTLQDVDLNVDSDLIDIYTVVLGSNTFTSLNDVVGDATNSVVLGSGDDLGRLLDITFNDQLWTTPTNTSCLTALQSIVGTDTGLGGTGFTLIETAPASGQFIGDFAIPSAWCRAGESSPSTTTGLDIEVNYVDFRDASGETIEVGDSAAIRANTGSVTLDRTVYPVPFGIPSDFATTSVTSPTLRSIFPIHQTGMNGPGIVAKTSGLDSGEFVANGDLTIHVRVNDPDFDTSAAGEDKIALAVAGTANVGPVKVSVLRGSSTVVLGFAGGPNEVPGLINVGNTLVGDGIIQNGELTITTAGTGFTPGAVVISQSGATNAAGTYTESGVGSIATSELTVISNVNGFASGAVDIFDGTNTATATWKDLNGDTNVDNNELTIINDGNGVMIPGTVSVQRLPGPVVLATVTYADSVGTIQDGEISITGGGSGFVNGGVTITQGASTAKATFRDDPSAVQFGPMTEIAPDAGIFESDIVIRYTDGPASTICPPTTDFTPLNGAPNVVTNPVTDRFTTAATSGNYCILQGDILQVEYTDPADASGDINTVTDSATFDLRNGVLQSDKSVYIIGSDMILTLIEPDFDLDNDKAETFTMDLIEWDSDAATVTMGNADGQQSNFDPEPLNFRETGDSTGIFQVVVQIPQILDGDKLERGEEISLEYTDWGPSGSDYVGDEDQDVKLTIFTSNFGATVALDQKVYTWTDKVYITIVAPDHNFDSNLIDDIGNTNDDPIKVATRSAKLSNYKLVETGTDTGIFTGEVILTGFTHDADGDPTTGPSGNDVTSVPASGSGPTSGKLPATDNDGLTVSFEFSQDETVVGSALIRWNIGEVQWLEASYPAKGTGVVRIIDPDMNLNPESVDNFNVNTWSDSDAGGIDLTVTETNEATGIFEGTVFFTVSDESSGHRLRVAEGDTVTAEYEDNTLPSPYTTADELRITATTLIGTIVPPLERAPAANLRVVDAFGNSLSAVNVDQQVQITADLANGQDKKQVFAYLVQIQDGNGVTVSLAWITGALSAGQSFSPALSWIPTEAGTYTATAFVWESVDNPTALSPPVSTQIIVT